MADDVGACPCGSGAALAACCGPIVGGDRLAPTAERLMRSRFTAFALGDAAHLLRSWHPSTRPDAVRFVPGQRWTHLEVVAVEAGGLLDAAGVVEFRAAHERRGRAGVLHERSRFVREGGRWAYVGPVDGPIR